VPLETLDILKRETNSAIRRILFQVEDAEQEDPHAHPYVHQEHREERRRVIVRTIWQLFRRLRPDSGGTDGDGR
jgi:hypothetical protein